MNHPLMSVEETKRDLNSLDGETDVFRQSKEKRKLRVFGQPLQDR